MRIWNAPVDAESIKRVKRRRCDRDMFNCYIMLNTLSMNSRNLLFVFHFHCADIDDPCPCTEIDRQ